MARLNIDGTRFTYYENGSGEPLVLVHGTASDYRTWNLQRTVFARQQRVIAYSRRYHWPNEPIPDGIDYSMEQHVDDLQRLLAALDATPAHLAGHSYGAFLCLLLALRQPRLVQTLILAEPPVITLYMSPRPGSREVLWLLATRPQAAVAIMKFAAAGVLPACMAFNKGNLRKGARIFGDAVMGDKRYHRLTKSRKAQVLQNLTNVKAELLGSNFAALDPQRLRGLQTPTLLLNAEHSISLFHHLANRLAELLPHCERMVIPAASHLMHEDNARAFNEAVLSFVARHSSAPPDKPNVDI